MSESLLFNSPVKGFAMWQRVIFTALGLLLASSSSFAMTTNTHPGRLPIKKINFKNSNTGFYMKGSYTNYKAIETTLVRSQMIAKALNFAAGINLSRNFATEVGYLYLPAAPAVNGNIGLIQNSFNAVAVAFKGILPINGTGMHLFAKVGPTLNFRTQSSLTSNDSNTHTQAGGLLYGFGMDYSLNNNLSMSLQYLSTLQQSKTHSGSDSNPALSSIQHNYGVFALNYTLQ